MDEKKDRFDRWRQWEKKGNASSFFQSADWAEILVRHFPQYCPTPIETDSFFIPLVRHRRCGGLSDSLYGMPMMTPGGVLAEKPLSARDWEEIFGLMAQAGVGNTVVSCPIGQESPLLSQGFEVLEASTHVLWLEEDWNDIWKRFDRHCRTEVRKALKLGVSVRCEKSEAAIRDHWDLIRARFLKWKPVPTPTRTFIRDAIDLAAGRLYQAVQGDRAVVTLLAFVYADEIFFWQGARVETEYPKGANNLLFSEVIRTACEEGLGRVNFGASLGNRGIEKFKEDFGARKTPYKIYRKTHPMIKWFRRN